MNRLVPWGLVAFAFVCPAGAAEFPTPRDTETDLTKQRLSPAEAAAAYRVPAGFSVGVFAAEPGTAAAGSGSRKTSPSPSGRGSSSRTSATAC